MEFFSSAPRALKQVPVFGLRSTVSKNADVTKPKPSYGVHGTGTITQLVLVVLFACTATWIFDVSGENSFARLLLVGPIFPGAVAGLYFSGHGGNHAVALKAALITNAVVWCAVWIILRRFHRAFNR